MSDAGYVRKDECEKRKRGWTAVTVVLFILALPVLVPIVLGGGVVVLGILLALAACGLAVIVGAGGCAAAGAICLAALLFCGIVGTGFGLVMLFSTPASGLAVLGTSLLAAGGSVLGGLIVWQAGRFFVWAVRKLADRLHMLFAKRNGNAEKAAEECGKREEEDHEE